MREGKLTGPSESRIVEQESSEGDESVVVGDLQDTSGLEVGHRGTSGRTDGWKLNGGDRGTIEDHVDTVGEL